MSNRPNLDDYVDVAARIASFKEAFPEGSLQSEIVKHTDVEIVVKAFAYRTPDDQRPGIGHAREVIPGRTPYTRDSEVMVAETSAWGRAIAALGFEVRKGIATREEVQAAQARQESSETVYLPQPKPSAPAPASARPWDKLPSGPSPIAAAVDIFKDDLDTKVISAALENICPDHKKEWVHRSGVSSKTGKPYSFWSCSGKTPDGKFCERRPSIEWQRAHE